MIPRDKLRALNSDLLQDESLSQDFVVVFQIQNSREFEKLKQRLLSEIEIIDHRVEWDPDKF